MTDMSEPDNSSLKGPAAAHWYLSALPILQTWRLVKKEGVRHDMLAGLALAAYSVPEALVNASLAGLPPQHGLYSFLTGGLFYSLFTARDKRPLQQHRLFP